MNANVSLSRIGKCYSTETVRAYIYIIFSKLQNAAYIGQTNDQNGAIGRLCGHLGQKGTFRGRLLDERGVHLYEIDDLNMFTYCLPSEASYVGRESAYREGVEYLVQTQLRNAALSPYLHIVSHVRYNDSVSLPFIQKTAQEVIESFIFTYHS